MNKIRMIEQRKILVPLPTIQKLQDEFGVGRVMVYNALRYSTNSERAQQIRHRAVTEYGGKEVKMPMLTTV